MKTASPEASVTLKILINLPGRIEAILDPFKVHIFIAKKHSNISVPPFYF